MTSLASSKAVLLSPNPTLIPIEGFPVRPHAFSKAAYSRPSRVGLPAGVGIGFVETTQHSAVASLAPVAFRGSAFGLLAAVQSVGNLAASSVAGLLWTLASPRIAFLYLVAWAAVALVLFGRVGARPGPNRPAVLPTPESVE